MIIFENMSDSLSMNIPCCLCYVIHYGGGEGVLNKVLHWEALLRGPNPSPFLKYIIFDRKGNSFNILHLSTQEKYGKSNNK